jgi:PIN domain nuclease of toxin-antitoxin system
VGHARSRKDEKGLSDSIRDAGSTAFYSAATVWELELKAAKGRLALTDDWIDAVERAGFRQLPVTGREARASARLPRHHADPFDRLLVAQAREHGLTIATRNAIIRQYDVPVLEV